MFFHTHTVGASLLSFFSQDTSEKSTHYAEVSYPSETSDNSQSIPLLQAARHTDPNLARGGGGVIVQNDALVAEMSPFAHSANQDTRPAGADQIAWYMVQEGDTLSQVATLFNVSVNTIVWANELSSNKDIRPGQTLLILPISGVQHTVKKGETLKGLAEKYRGDVEEIITYNNLPEEGTLAVGSVITIPGGAIEEEKKETVQNTRGGTVVSSGPAISGYFIHPVPGAVRTQGIHGYNAVDFGAPVGTPILAAARGTVIVARVGGWNGGYGNYLVIEHPNGTQTLYAHNSRHAVSQGDTVVQGQVIAYVGNTGRSTGPHLHIEVRGAKNPY
jgi:murein DD-endopeptidase MepM/ murein hydrolase activator NlpD